MRDFAHRDLSLVVISGVTVALLLAALAVHFCDVPFSDYLQQLRIRITPFGRTLQLLGKYDVAWFSMFFVCWATGNRRLLWRFGWAAAASGIFVLLVKLAVGRTRPNGEALSFPSGDTSIAFVWATVIAAEYRLLGVPAFLAAAVIGLMRVTGGMHYPSDVLAGAATGFAAAGISVYMITDNVPRWLYRATRRTRWGLLLVGGFVGGMAARAATDSRWWPAVVLAVAIVVLVFIPVLISKRKACAKLARRPEI